MGVGFQGALSVLLKLLVEPTWEFPKIGVPYFGVLIIRILLFRVS